MGILIRKGRVVDAASHIDQIQDLYLEKGLIQEIGENLEVKNASDTVIDAEGLLVMPGIIDLHVHLRDPGQTQKEDIESGTRAAARGGVTTLVAMPNTTPVIDSPDRLNYVKYKAESLGKAKVLQAGALTKGMNGEELADIPGMVEAGMKAMSEDGKSVLNSKLFRDAAILAAKYDIPILDHCEDMDLRAGGCMNDDENAKRLGLPGISNSTEDVIAARDILIAKEVGARLHLCHCSTEGAARMMQALKREGETKITAEVCPHHLILTSDDIKKDDPNFKMNPPLRKKKDVDALREALLDGSIQVISTDHAPHTPQDKAGSMRTAAFGIVGIETSFALMYTEFVETGLMTLEQLIEKMCLNPANVLKLPCGRIAEGAPADLMIADLDKEYEIHGADFLSKGRNMPYEGRKVKGEVRCTICRGNVVYKATR